MAISSVVIAEKYHRSRESPPGGHRNTPHSSSLLRQQVSSRIPKGTVSGMARPNTAQAEPRALAPLQRTSAYTKMTLTCKAYPRTRFARASSSLPAAFSRVGGTLT
mmetsp:Transcript_30146/g.66046  ORF Transcript_30146/g.66046 Transcript_30146/m.66046 type:complete len:106 (-) Transcript_30146:806-1123(-)|eukprot:6173527-Pleurochrysis_carterae.AAC.1